MSGCGKRFTLELAGPGFDLGLWNCTHDHRGPGAEQRTGFPAINVVLRGMYARHVGRKTVIADPTVALLSNPDDSWRSSHPTGQGDVGIWVRVHPTLAPERGWQDRVRPLAPSAWLDWASLVRDPDPERALLLITDVIGLGLAVSREPAFVAQVRSILADRLRDPPGLDVLAAEVGVSPWHLCRTFHTVTGSTPRAYAEQLRLRAAARRIDDGCTDLTSLAFELGYSSHSHLTARFRQAFGRTPSALRTARS